MNVPEAPQRLQQAMALHRAGQLASARALYEEILSREPEHFDALHLLGVTAAQSGNPQQAALLIGRALSLDPKNAAAHMNHGLALRESGALEAALASLERAIALRGDFAEAFYHRGLVLKQLKQLTAALASFDRAIALRPDLAEAHCDRGNLLKELKHFEAALASYDRALALKAGFAGAHANRGNVLRDLARYEEAVRSYDAALACSAPPRTARAMRLYAAMHIARWRDLDSERARLAADIERGEAAAHPFGVLALCDDGQLQRRAAANWVRAECPADESLGGIGRRARHPRIRVGYFSADFREHAVATLIAGVFEAHDRARFEVSGFSFGPDTGDPMRRRLERAFERFVDVRERGDREVALLARDLEIDIAVDLGGFTADARPRVFALRAAPVQLSYLGYVGTMAAPYMDYLIADAALVPPAARCHYTEKIVYVPSYQANDGRRAVAEERFSRGELGLPATGMVYCCFNASYKLNPATFDSWMRILQATPGSVLFLYAGSAALTDNLRREARARGVAAERLVFGGKLPFAQYLARYRTADLFLDTLPFNAGTTASDALWAGLPVLTCAGEAFAARMGASLLRAVGLPELITTSMPEYERLAIGLGHDGTRLTAMRQTLAARRDSAPLFDTARFTRGLEQAYLQMYERHHAGLPVEHIEVEPQL
jgi:predicted O-linked N-acetylglucosamine transferase (SPINDLY family)